MTAQPRFAIVGGGIAGLTTAIALQRRGFQTDIFESAPQIKPLGAGLTLAGNAVKALLDIGIAEPILRRGKIIKAMQVLDEHGSVLSQTDAERLSKKLGLINNFSIHRADLHEALLGEIQPGSLHLNKQLEDFSFRKNETTLHFRDGNAYSADYVIACDGIHSVLRKKLVPGSEPRYAGYTCWRGIIDASKLDIDPNITSETWGRGARFGIVPLTSHRIYWFACLNARQNDSVMRSYRIPDLLIHFSHYHSPVSTILKHTSNDQLLWNDIYDIDPLSKFSFGKILLTGDAAHATTPNLGQGACMAMEDAAVLANALTNHRTVEEAFVAFNHLRVARTTKIVRTSRRIGAVAQWENPVLARLRDTLVRWTPERMAEKQVRFLTHVNFM